MNPILLASASLILPPIWGWIVWWALDRLWPASREPAGRADDELSGAADPGLLDFQI